MQVKRKFNDKALYFLLALFFSPCGDTFWFNKFWCFKYLPSNSIKAKTPFPIITVPPLTLSSSSISPITTTTTTTTEEVTTTSTSPSSITTTSSMSQTTTTTELPITTTTMPETTKSSENPITTTTMSPTTSSSTNEITTTTTISSAPTTTTTSDLITTTTTFEPPITITTTEVTFPPPPGTPAGCPQYPGLCQLEPIDPSTGVPGIDPRQIQRQLLNGCPCIDPRMALLHVLLKLYYPNLNEELKII